MILGLFKRHLKMNPGVALIIGFQVLLVTAAVLLVSGNSNGANQVAVYGFYVLALGVGVQLVVAIKEEKKRSQASDNSAPKSS